MAPAWADFLGSSAVSLHVKEKLEEGQSKLLEYGGPRWGALVPGHIEIQEMSIPDKDDELYCTFGAWIEAALARSRVS